LSIFETKQQTETLKKQLEEKRTALEEILAKIDEYKLLKERLLTVKKKISLAMRIISLMLLATVNILYVHFFGAKDGGVQDTLRCITAVNGSLFLLVGAGYFLKNGSFVNLKDVYHHIQTMILEKLYKKDEETIEAVLTTNLESRESICKEIEEIEAKIKSNEEKINQVFQEPILEDNSLTP